MEAAKVEFGNVIGENGKTVCPGVVCKCGETGRFCPMHGSMTREQETAEVMKIMRETNGNPELREHRLLELARAASKPATKR